MKKYSLLLLPLLIGFVFNACDSECCGPVEETTPPPPQPDLVAPTVNELNLNGIDANNECTPGETINITADTSDTDGTVTDTIWKIDGQEVANPTTTCPDDGQTRTICAIAVDNDGLKSDEKCVIITGKAAEPELKNPTAIITPGECSSSDAGDNTARWFACGDSHDNDDIDPTPDIGRTDTNIYKCEWEISVVTDDDTIAHPLTYVTFLEDGGIAPDSTAVEPKWIGQEGNYKIIKLTVTDDDGQQDTVIKKYDYTLGQCGELVDIN